MDGTAGKRVTIILPALNEEQTVGKVIDEIPREAIEGRGYALEVVVVDNDSTDRTREIAEAKGATVLVERRRGKGNAVRAAFKSVDGDFMIMLDADYTYPAEHIPSLLDVLQNGCDVVIGSRLKGRREAGAIKKLNVVGNYLLVFMATVLYGTRISDVCSGYWGFRKEVVERLNLDAVGFELEANMFAEVAKKGYRIAEVPVMYRRRPNESKLGSLRAGFRIGRTLVKKRFQ